MYSNKLQLPHCLNQLKVSQGKLHCTIHTSSDGGWGEAYFKGKYLGNNYKSTGQ